MRKRAFRSGKKVLLPVLALSLQAPAFGILSAAVFGSELPAEQTQSVISVNSGQQLIEAHELNGASSLSVASGATAIINFGQISNLNIAGNIENSGTIYAVSGNPAIQTASLSALNILNNQGGLISTALPAGSSFAGLSGLNTSLNLSLTALNNVVNAGTISSAAGLSIAAGNSVINTGAISAASNLQIISGLAGLANSGSITSIAGNIGISNLASQNLLVSNTNGVISALLGNIDLSTQALSSLDKLNISLVGGDILAKELNLSTQEGIASIDVADLTGRVSISAGEVHIRSATENLDLGSMNITGDPTYYNQGDITINGNLSFSGQNLAIIASGNITTSGGTAWNISTSSAGNAGNILMIAGVSFTPAAGGTGGTASNSVVPDNSTQIVLNGPGGGGNIDLTSGAGIATLDASSTSNGQGGSVTLIAYGGSVSLPTAVTINTGTALSNAFTLNGNVTIIAGANSGQGVSIGNINAAGNSVNPSINNGLVNIFSATPVMYQAVNQQTAPTSFTNLNGGQFATQTYIIVTDATNVTAGQQLILNPNGANPEQVTVAASYTTGTTIPLQNPLQFNHGSSEYVSTQASSLTTFANAGPTGPIIQNGGFFGPGTLQNGNISVGSISSGANVIIGTNAGAGGGSVNLNGNITLSQNPTATLPFNDTPVLQVSGQQVSVAASQTISSAISGCSFCQDQLNIFTSNLNNAGSISGSFVNIKNQTASTLTVSNSGSISAINPGSVAGNPWLNIQSAGGINFNTGSGSSSNFSTPTYGVISVNAADNNSITFNGTQIMTVGTGGLITISAQGAGSTLNLASGSSLVAAAQTPGFGGSFLNISSPNLNFANNSSIQGVQSSMFFNSGSLVQSPQDLSITVAANASAQIISGQGQNIVLRPSDGQNIVFNSGGSGSSLAFSGAPVYLFTGTSRSTGTAGQITTNAGINVTAPTSFSAVDPNGGITGIAFQPYVGPATTFPSSYTLFGTYTYPQVLLLMAPIAQTGLFQNLGTYSQGAFLGPGNPDNTQKSSYVITGASSYTIEAAKQMGFTVTAGAYSQNPDKSINLPPTQAEIDFAIAQAVKHGNVMDMVIGNECIVGGANPLPSTTTLIQAMNYAQNLRNTTTSLTATTLPITTRQAYGVLSGVTSFQSTVDMLNGCTGCQATYGLLTPNFEGANGHVYGDVYPYYDGTNSDGTVVATQVVGYLVPSGVGATSITSISQSDFQTLVTAAGNISPPPAAVPAPPPITAGIQADLNGTLQAFQTKSITPQLWVAESGWATGSTGPTNVTSSNLPNNAPQANLNWASWYYPDMQSWSYSNKSSYGLSYQIPINGYFEAYDEPWKYSTATWQGGEPNFGVWTASGTNLTASNPTPAAQFQLTGIAQKYTLPVYNQSKTAPLPAPPTQASSGGAALGGQVPTNTGVNLALLAFNQSLFNLNTAVSGDRGTIVPTDLLPELKATTEASSSNPGAFSSNGGISGQAGNSGVLGAGIFNQALLQQNNELNPDVSLLTFSGNNMLLAPDHDMSVQTQLAQISIEAGAAVMLIQSGGQLAVFALHDDRSGAVRVTVDGQTMELPVGRQLLLSKDQKLDFAAANSGKISYRNLSEGKLGGLKSFVSEFSMPAALSSVQSLRQLLRSKNKEEIDLARKLLKTAAAMITINKNKAPFKPSS